MVITKRRKLQEVKAKFSQVVDEVLALGPQVVTRHGKDTIVMMSSKEFESLSKPKNSFLEFMLSAPRVELDITRSKEPLRDIDL